MLGTIIRLALPIFSVFVLFVSATESAAYKVGNWDIDTYPRTGSKSGCIMTGKYADGTELSVMVSRQHQWGIGFFNPNWKLNSQSETRVVIVVDGKNITSGVAKHLRETHAYLPLTGAEPYAALQRGRSLDIITPEGKLNFQLPGTARAMAATLDCVNRLNGHRGPEVARPVAPQDQVQEVSQAEAAVLLTNLLNAAGIVGYKLAVPAANKSGASYSIGDSGGGMLIAARGRTRTADDYATYFRLPAVSSG